MEESGEFTIGNLSRTSKSAWSLTCNANENQKTLIRLLTSTETTANPFGPENLKRLQIQTLSQAIGEGTIKAFLAEEWLVKPCESP
jgi:hypothetical protein